MAAVEPEAHQRGARARAGLDRCGGVGSVVTEHIPRERYAVLLGEPAELRVRW